MNKYKNFLINWICEKKGLEKESIKSDVNMFENDYIDSLGFFGLLMDLEMEFDITLDENDILDHNASTIEGLVNILIKKGS